MAAVISVSPQVLSLANTLPVGQTFRWQQTSDMEWTGAIGKRLFILKQSDQGIRYRIINGPTLSSDRHTLEKYFQLDVDIQKLYTQWSEADEVFRDTAADLKGVRILKQDPLETLIAFICSSNNNIPRISQMMNKLCATYGEWLGDHAGCAFHSFPSLHSLTADSVESKLRELGFGYRAKYVSQAACYVQERSGGEWLNSLCEHSYEEAWKELQNVPGVGPKVADCVCLMALDKPQAVPVDTHILQLAVQHYGIKMKSKSLSLKMYSQIGNLFRSQFGGYAGWTQAVMFSKEVEKVVSVKRKQEASLDSDKACVAKKKR